MFTGRTTPICTCIASLMQGEEAFVPRPSRPEPARHLRVAYWNIMNLINNLKIGSCLAAAFAMVLALTLALGAFAVLQLAKVNQTSTRPSSRKALPPPTA